MNTDIYQTFEVLYETTSSDSNSTLQSTPCLQKGTRNKAPRRRWTRVWTPAVSQGARHVSLHPLWLPCPHGSGLPTPVTLTHSILNKVQGKWEHGVMLSSVCAWLPPLSRPDLWQQADFFSHSHTLLVNCADGRQASVLVHTYNPSSRAAEAGRW